MPSVHIEKAENGYIMKLNGKTYIAEKERRPVGASDDPRPRMEKACERLSEPPEPERARAFWCLPPAPFFGYLYKQQSYEGDNFNVTFATNLHRLKRRYSVSGE